MITLLQKKVTMTMDEFEARTLCDALGTVLSAGVRNLPSNQEDVLREIYQKLNAMLTNPLDRTAGSHPL